MQLDNAYPVFGLGHISAISVWLSPIVRSILADYSIHASGVQFLVKAIHERIIY